MTNWVALACTPENELLAWAENLSLLESACEGEFRAICKIYAVSDLHMQQLKQGNLDFVIRFNGPRETTLVSSRKDLKLMALSQLLTSKVALFKELHQRLMHGYKRFTPIVDWQLDAYKEKYRQALLIRAGDQSDIGFVKDYAIESGLDLETAAGLIINKYENRIALIRKLERLRNRHQIAIRNARKKEDFNECRVAMEADSFLSMMM